MAWKWTLGKFILRRIATTQGFLDPMAVLARLQRFGQPSEVWVPTELLRSGAVLQARGLINSQAIQHNLDWVWPFWVERQFNPEDRAFIPRAFSMTHINLTHRNWTGLGVPDFPNFPIVDPCGLVTPFFDGWSIDGWLVGDETNIIPSQLMEVEQTIHFNGTLGIATLSKSGSMTLESRSEVKVKDGIPMCEIVYKALSSAKIWLAISARPYNPEGISFINDIKKLPEAEGWNINGKEDVFLSEKPARYLFSNYHAGDIRDQIPPLNTLDSLRPQEAQSISCPIGMASSAALYELQPNEPKEIIVTIPLSKTKIENLTPWREHLGNHCTLKIPDSKFQFLYEVALRTLILHSPGDVYPGPFTYKRFWFRDAAYILYAMLAAGLSKNIEKIIDRFPSRQTPLGYFMSQDGEWDSNGQAIWVMQRFMAMTNAETKPQWRSSIYHGARWIQSKRLPVKETQAHAGLLPAGFSAEHLGPSDFYYWDDFWAVAGLKAASSVAQGKDPQLAKRFGSEADGMMNCIEKSLSGVQSRFHHMALPASPHRRMDGGAIGSLVASYPLQLLAPDDKRMLNTVNFIMKEYFLQGGFYHEISHSGINAYLTLHVAQVLLRAGDPRFFDVVKAVADLASPTGQWPEAIHPGTKGGCMGDGQHVWAAAEWVLMIRNMFVREEENTRTLIIASGIPQSWLKEEETLFLGPTLTIFGKISISIKVQKDIHISWEAQWHNEAPAIKVQLPGYPEATIRQGENSIRLQHTSQRQP